MENKKKVGLEAIAYQNNGKLHSRMAARLSEIIALGDSFDQSDFQRINLPAIIKEETNITATVSINFENFQVNASVVIPAFDSNNPIMRHIEREYGTTASASKLTAMLGDKRLGGIDMKSGKVTGIFADLPIAIELSAGIFSSGASAELISAGILHELGHYASYIESALDTVATSYAVRSVAENILGIDDENIRIKYITDYASVLGVKLDKNEVLVDGDAGGIALKFLQDVVANRRSANGTIRFNEFTWEALSDQFAVRHGAGRHLAELAMLIASDSWDATANSRILWAATQIVTAFMALQWKAICIAIPIFIPIMYYIQFCWVDNLGVGLNERPYDRIKRIRNEMVGNLRDKTITPLRRRQLINDIETVDKILDGIHNYGNWWTAINKYLTTAGRQQNKKIKFQRMMEDLSNNDLNIAAAKLKDI